MTHRWFTSDPHFLHTNIINLSHRPFPSVEDMTETIVGNWNSVVGHDDEVWVLGDVALGKIADSLPIVGRLNGIKVLVPGNHDRIFSGNKQSMRDRFWVEYENVFDSIQPEITSITIGGHSVKVSHFPFAGDSHDEDRHADKRPIDDGRPLIHGHVHEKWKTNGRQFNVGVDVNNFFPVAESTIIDWIRSL